MKCIEEDTDDSYQNTPEFVVSFWRIFLMHKMKMPVKFWEISSKSLQTICNSSKKLDIIFDTYPRPSIKDYAHRLRDGHACEYQIQSSEMQRNCDFAILLKMLNLKKHLQIL